MQPVWCAEAQCLDSEMSKMFITTKTIVSFHPVDEYEKILTFKEQNDMNEWKEYISTVSTTFIREETVEVK